VSSGYAQNLKFQIRAAGLPTPVAEHRFHPVRKWRMDLAWPDRMIAVEVDGGTWIGGRHSRGKGFEADCEKQNAAATLGWRCFKFTTAMVKSGAALNTLTAALQAAEGAI
jgi:very-short-patch-repair endonuclease